MPRIPTYQSGQVGPVETTGARFRAPDMPRSGVGDGMQNLGQALGQFAQVQDAIVAQSEDTQARAAALEMRGKLNGVLTNYGSLQGGNAVDAQGATLEQLKAIRDQAGSALKSPRMKSFFDRYSGESYADAVGKVNGHALQQVQVQRKSTLTAEVQSFGESAVANWMDANARSKDIEAGKSSIEQLGQMQGLSGEAIALEQRKFVSGVHANTIDQMLTVANPDYEVAAGYLIEHGAEMLSGDRERISKDLQGPMQFRDDYSSFMRAVSTGDAGNGTPVQQDGKGWTKVATDVASRFGLAPNEVAAVMSYETGGTFSPTVMGGKNKQYMGLIQFGPAERAKYGIDAKSSPEQWSKAVGDFLSDRGFKRGMGIKDLYSTINAGQPGRYGASDGNGTVESHVDKILREHMPVADKWLAGGGVVPTEMPRTWDKDSAYNRIDALADKEGWSIEKRERVKGVADRQIARDEQLLDRQYRAAGQDAVQVIAGLGDNFTDISQIPSAIRNRADPTDVLKWAETARKNKDEKAKLPDNTPEAIILENEWRRDPDAFLKQDLAKFVGKVAPGQLLRLQEKRSELLGQRNKPQDDNLRSAINSAVLWQKKYGGVEVSDKDFPRVFDAAMAYMQAKGIKHASEKDADEAVRSALREVPTDRYLFGAIPVGRGSKRAFELTLDDIPDSANKWIDAHWQGRGKPNDVERLDLYRQMVANAGG